MKLHKLTCPNCGGMLNMKIADDTTSVFCPYCGQRFWVDDEKREYTINKNINVQKNISLHKRYTDDADVIRAHSAAKKDHREFKLTIGLILISLLILVLVGGILFLNDEVSQSQGKVNAGYYKDLIGKNYETVEAHFEAAGFTNIQLVDLNDAGITFWRKNKVDTISVGGKIDFEETDWFYPDTPVIISYH